MPRLTFAVTVVGWFALASPFPCPAETWPTFRHDAARSGYSAVALGASRLTEAWRWKSDLPPSPAWDGPARWDAYAKIPDLPAMRQYDAAFHVVSDGERLYFGSSSQDRVSALRLSDGGEAWNFVAGGPVRLAPTLHDDLLYFGCDDGAAYCLNAMNGELVWRFSPSEHLGLDQRLVVNDDRLISYYPVRTGVLVRDGRAYFGAALLPWREAVMCAVDADTGSLTGDGTFVATHEDATLEGAMLATSDRIIVPQGRVAPLLFDRRNGDRLGNLPGGGGVTVVLTDQGEILRAEGGAAARPGQVGVYKGQEQVASFPRGRAMVVRPDTMFVIDNTQLFAARRADNELLWRTKLVSPLELIMADNILFVGGRDEVTAVDAGSGEILWREETDGRAFGLMIASERLVVSTDRGSIHVFAPTADEKWGSDPLEPTNTTRRRAVPIKQETDPRLLHRWVFQHNGMEADPGDSVDGTELSGIIVRDQVGVADATLQGAARTLHLDEGAPVDAVFVDESYFSLPESAAAKLPEEQISVTAWVRVDKPLQWGGIVGCVQDDGNVEHGWLLGYRDDRFSFAVAAPSSGLTYLTSTEAFVMGDWHHVAGTFDGRVVRLYVNGQLAGTSEEETGPISYPAKRAWTLAAYHDANEHFPMTGALHEVRVYSAALAEDEVRSHVSSRAGDFPPEPTKQEEKVAVDGFISWGPVARFVEPGTVEVRYGTFEPMGTHVAVIRGDEQTIESNLDQTKEHKLEVDGLPYRRQLGFSIMAGPDATSPATEEHVLDCHFNWTRPPREPVSDWAAEVYRSAPNPHGIAVVVGQSLAQRAAELSRSGNMSVLLLVEDQETAQRLRTRATDSSEIQYGAEFSVRSGPMGSLPGALASIVVAAKDTPAVRRLARPDGVLWVGDDATWQRPALEGAGTWSHMYGRTDNSAFGGEQLGGAKTRQELVTQWIGRPGPRYQTDRQNRKPTPLAVGGRLYLQGLQRLLALDAFSGSILWTMETPTIMRWNVPHDCSNWCADDDAVFVAARDQAWAIDGATGAINDRYLLPGVGHQGNRGSDQPRSWGYIALHEDLLLGTNVLRSAIFTDWWGGENWYDSTGGGDTHVVCGDQLFALDKETGKSRWTHDAIVLHPTITILRDRIVFVEDRTQPKAPGRRIPLDANRDLVIVSLDVSSGTKLWEADLDQLNGHASVLYLAGGATEDGEQHLVMVVSESEASQFTVDRFNPATGERGWTAKVAWEANHHGKHISRPAVQGGLIYLRPEVLSLTSGEQIVRGFPDGHGCASYALCTQGMIGRLGSTTWWDPRTETTSRFPRLRTDCWISAIPAQGLLLSAEGGGGCSCGTWIETSLAFLPRSVDKELPTK